LIRVLVADDEAIVRDGLRVIIELADDLTVVAEAGDGAEAIEMARQFSPDVALVDIQMPGMDGIEASRQLLALPSPPRVLILTTFDRNEYVYQAMKLGASGFLLKDTRRQQLIDAVRAVASGDRLVAPSVTMRLIEEFCHRPPPRTRPDSLAELTPREVEVLTLVGRGLSNTEIAAALYVAETTVKTHIARILVKLALRDRTQAVVAAYESGLVRPGEQ
jgi:DNA-binding NarL/FixJ family response regulator